MEDHGRFYPKAQNLDRPLYHNECGSLVSSGSGGYYSAAWVCTGTNCKGRWNDDTIKRFASADLAQRFHNRPENFDTTAVTLVDVDNGEVRYTSLVPVTEAHKYKKAKI